MSRTLWTSRPVMASTMDELYAALAVPDICMALDWCTSMGLDRCVSMEQDCCVTWMYCMCTLPWMQSCEATSASAWHWRRAHGADLCAACIQCEHVGKSAVTSLWASMGLGIGAQRAELCWHGHVSMLAITCAWLQQSVVNMGACADNQRPQSEWATALGPV